MNDSGKTKIVAGGGAGSVVALVAVYVAGRFNVNLNADDGAVIATATTAVCAFLAHNGIVGLARILWRGDQQPNKRALHVVTPPDTPAA